MLEYIIGFCGRIEPASWCVLLFYAVKSASVRKDINSGDVHSRVAKKGKGTTSFSASRNQVNVMEKNNVKVCFAASSGGHYEEILMLKPLMDKYDSFVITEETPYKTSVKGEKTYYLSQVNRKEKSCFPKMVANTFKSLKIFFKEMPDVVICTGGFSNNPDLLDCQNFL